MIIATALLVLLPRRAHAECTRNALSTATLVEPALSAERRAVLTDGAVVPEGAPWPAPEFIVAVHGPVTFDLGSARTFGRVFLQLDADQPFEVATSVDREAWTRVAVESHPTASGMLSRIVTVPSLPARYLRLSPAAPGTTVTLAEVLVPCAQKDITEGLRVVDAHEPPAGITWIGRAVEAVTGQPALTPRQVAIFKLFIALGAVTWLVMEWAFARARRVTHGVLALLAVVAVSAYYDLGAYRYPHFIHEHDVFHYFVGAKYFPELGYDALYTCSAAAEAEAGFGERVLLRAQRDLKTNQIVGGDQVLRGAAGCRSRFNDAAWRDFSADVRYFADTRNVEDWHRVLKDHGFNASPVWITFGRALARFLHATEATIGHGSRMWSGIFGPLDPLLLLASLGALGWALGLRTAALVAILFGVNPFSDFSWIGGGFLRELWFAALVFGICLAKRGRFFPGGALVGVSAGLQLFPVVCILSVAFALLVGFVARRTMSRDGVRFVVGAIAALAMLVPLSLLVDGRADAWSAFAGNTEKHARTPSVNLMGLPTALSFRSSTRAALLFDENATDPFARVREARRENFRAAWPFAMIFGLLGIGLLYRRVQQGAPWWWVAVLGLPLVALLLETSCYYVAWLALLGLLGVERRAPLFVAFGVVLAGLALEIVVAELDVKYALGSVVLAAGALLVLAVARPAESSNGAAQSA